jgi:hypothetical protein
VHGVGHDGDDGGVWNLHAHGFPGR